MSWSVGTKTPIAKSAISNLVQQGDIGGTDRDQLNAAVHCANTLAALVGDDQSHVSVSISGHGDGLSVAVNASPAPATPDKVPYPEDGEPMFATPESAAQAIKRLERGQGVDPNATDGDGDLEGDEVPGSFQGTADEPKGRGFGKGRK